MCWFWLVLALALWWRRRGLPPDEVPDPPPRPRPIEPRREVT
jgi:hypothetical protein